MPKRNAIKIYGEDCYYHVYNRGVAKMDIFLDSEDYKYMLSLFGRHLSGSDIIEKNGRIVRDYSNDVEIVAYCLMSNHYHLLVYLKEKRGLELLMRSVMTAYSMYFNKKYNRTGGLFEGRFLASRITSDEYLWQVSRYIHLNPNDAHIDYRTYRYSSFLEYCDEKVDGWLHSDRIVKIGNSDKYEKFVADGLDYHELYHQIRHELAN